MGGALSLAAGVHHPGVLDGAIAFYGAPPAELADVSTIRIPVQAHFGEVDPLEGFSDAAACERLKEQLAKAAVSHDVYTYPGMGHAFMNTSKELRDAAGVTEPYSPEVVSLAYSRVASFARTHLHASEDSD
jgi:carboxymethylenebutenolidase